MSEPNFRKSDTIYVRGLPWNIIFDNDDGEQVELKKKILGFNLECSNTEYAGKLTNYL
jgi:hypothetical protein